VGNIDLDWAKENRDQLWAEALIEYKAGERWWLEEKEEESRKAASLSFRQDDPWAPILDSWLAGRWGETITTRSIMEEALSLEKHQMRRPVEMRISSIMAEFGYVKKRARLKGERVYAWTRDADVIEMNEMKTTTET